MTVGEVAAILRARAAQIMQQRAVTMAVIKKWTSARESLLAATSGAESREAAQSVRTLRTAITALERASELLSAASEHIAAYGPALGVDLGGANGEQVRRPESHSDEAESTEPASWVRDAGRSLPDRPGDVGPTHGRLFDLAGTEVTDARMTHASGHFRSGTVADARDGLRPDWFPHAQVIREHVESHAAAVLRRPGSPPEAVLIINKPTCRSRRRYVGCDQVLPGMLPLGKRLMVFVTDGQQTRLQAVYTGTGEGISS